MVIGCTLVVAAVAATVATGALLEVKSFTDALKLSPQLKLGDELAGVNPGGPQTLLLIGSDKRARGAVAGSGSAPRTQRRSLQTLGRTRETVQPRPSLGKRVGKRASTDRSIQQWRISM